MKRRLMSVMLVLVVVLTTASPTFAQTEQSPGEIPAATGTETPQLEPPQEGTSQLPILTITNTSGQRVPVEVEIADTPEERQTGLMGRSALPEDAGMLFVFDQEQLLSFWMKDTLIPLSIAYIDVEGRIVDIQDMQPLDETSHVSVEPAQYALEVNQGFFEEREVTVGDMVELPVDQGSVAPPETADQPVDGGPVEDGLGEVT
jgi:uncharacterized protein